MCLSTGIPFLLASAVVLGRVKASSDVSPPPPVFRSIPTTIKTTIHDTVLLPCYVENLGANSIRWWKDGQLIWDTSDVKVIPPSNMRVFPNQTLEVADLKDSDTGDYICQVVRPSPWNPINQAHAIEVLVPPHVKTMPESGEIEVELGQEAIIGCIVSGVPKPIVTWSFKGKPLELINNRATLRFRATDRKMAGVYQCTATNGVGDSAAAAIRLKILYRPDVGAERLWIHTSPGERADISCTVFSDPDSKVEWFHEDKAVELGDSRIMLYHEGEKHRLIIKRVTSGDLGFYTCRATNMFGRAQQSIHLSGVANPAAFKRGPKQSSARNYTLIWEVESYSPIIEYKLLFKKHQSQDWMEVIIPVDPYSQGPIYSRSYTLTGLEESTVYEASVMSRNPFGWSRPSHIFRFATKGTDLNVKEDGLHQGSKEEDEVQEQPYPEIMEKEVQNTIQGGAAPIYNDVSSSESINNIVFSAYLPFLLIVILQQQ